MKKEKVKKWIEEHEDAIHTSMRIVIGVTVAAIIGKKVHDGFKTRLTPGTKTITYSPKIEVPKTIRELPSELRDLGFEVYSDGFTENSNIQAMINVYGLE